MCAGANIGALCAAELGCVAEFLAAADLVAFARSGRSVARPLAAAPAWRRHRGELGALLEAADVVAARLLCEVYDFSAEPAIMNAAFVGACEAGLARKAAFLSAHGTVANSGSWERLLRAASAGHLELVRWLAPRFGRRAVAAALGEACREGHGAVAAWLADEAAARSLTADEAAARSLTADGAAARSLTADEAAARSTTADGAAARSLTADEAAARSLTADEAAARSLTADEAAARSLTADDVRAGAPGVLARACEGGHLAVAVWLVGRFGLGPGDVRGGGGALLRGAAAAGHLAVAAWAAGRFGLTGADAWACGGHALRSAAANGDLAVVCWLWRRFPRPRDEVRTVAVAALHAAARRDRPAVVRWLVAGFGLDAAVAGGALPGRRRDGQLPPLTTAERWLAEQFALKIENGHD